MGLLQKAVETYNYHKSLVGKLEACKSPLLPISHIMQNSQLEISINLDGEFVSVRELERENKDHKVSFEQMTIIPVTIDSSSRSGKNPAANPLCDKLTYLIGAENSKHQEYMQLLSAWEASTYGDKKLTAIKRYLEAGTLINDLVREKVLKLNQNGDIADKEKLLQYMVRWRVCGCEVEECWRDNNLFQKWVEYYDFLIEKEQRLEKNICMISGNMETLTTKIPTGMLRTSGKTLAKLISSNDTANFVFRGRFIDAKQASSIGYTTFQKAFVILQWLSSNSATSFTVADRTFLCWNPKGKFVPKPNESIFGSEVKDSFTPSDYKQNLQNTLSGLKNNLPDEEDVVIAVFDAATKGRLATVYYNEIRASDFLERINSWYGSCCYWVFNKKVQCPKLDTIIRFAFGVERGNGDNIKVEVDDNALKQHTQRVFKCLLEKLPIPFDIVRALTMNASYPQRYTRRNREKLLSVACAVIRKYYNDKAQKEEWTMSLDKNNVNRSYLFGRLLAVMEKVEGDTFNENENREPNAVRLQSAFSSKPFSMLQVIYERVNVYFRQLKPRNRVYYKNLMGEIIDKIETLDKTTLNKPLEPMYLLGYYSQRKALYTSKNEKQEEEK